MTVKESLNNQEADELCGISEELSALEMLSKAKCEKRFEELKQDGDIINANNKILNKCSELVFHDSWEKMKNIDVSYFLDNIKDLELWKYAVGKNGLDLPYSKFSDLNNEQKVNFMSLYETINKGPKYASRLTVDFQIQSNYRKMDQYFEDNNSGLLGIVKGNFGILEKTLKKDFGLSEVESNKMVEYLQIINRFPEFVGNVKFMEAGFKSYFIVACVAFLVGAGFGIYGIKQIQKWKTPDKKYKGDDFVIDDPEKIKHLLTQKWHVMHKGHMDKRRYEVEGKEVKDLIYSLSELNGLETVKNIKDILKQLRNKADYIHLDMYGDLDFAVDFDLEGSTLSIDRDTGEMVLKVKKPDVIPLRTKVEITNRETGLVSTNLAQGVELECRDKLIQESIEQLTGQNKNNNKFYNEVKASIEEDLLDFFTSFAPTSGNGEVIQVTSVRVEYIDEVSISYPAGR